MLKSIIQMLPILFLTACISAPPKVAEISPSPVPIVAARVEKPALPACSRKRAALDLEIYDQCILEGMTFVTVSNIIGFPGTPVSSSGDTTIYQWRYNDTYMTVSFVNNKLTGKSQIGLGPCTYLCN
jgi:hypothetical protein